MATLWQRKQPSPPPPTVTTVAAGGPLHGLVTLIFDLRSEASAFTALFGHFGLTVHYAVPGSIDTLDLEAWGSILLILPPGEAKAEQQRLVALGYREIVTISPQTTPAQLAETLSAAGDWSQALRQLARMPAAAQFRLTLEGFFQAAHAITTNDKLGERHTHSWRVAVAVENIGAQSMIVPFAEARQLLDNTLGTLEGHYLNTVAPFNLPGCEPTLEQVTAVVFHRLAHGAARGDFRVQEVTVWETPVRHCHIVAS